MDQCTATVPPLYQIDPHRASACFLAPMAHKPELPTIEGDVTGVFRSPERILARTGGTIGSDAARPIADAPSRS